MALIALIFAALVATSVATDIPHLPAVTDKGLSHEVESVHGHAAEVPPVDGSNVVHPQAQLRQARTLCLLLGLGCGYGGGFGGGYGGGFGRR